MTFEEFVSQTRVRNVWLREPGISLYVRRHLLYARIELASMEADQPGRGSLTQFLDRYEPQHKFWVENVINPRLKSYLLRRGYKVMREDGGIPCMCCCGGEHLSCRDVS